MRSTEVIIIIRGLLPRKRKQMAMENNNQWIIGHHGNTQVKF